MRSRIVQIGELKIEFFTARKKADHSITTMYVVLVRKVWDFASYTEFPKGQEKEALQAYETKVLEAMKSWEKSNESTLRRSQEIN